MKLKTVTNMEIDAFIDRTSASIRTKITEGSTALKDNRVQVEIYEHLMRMKKDNKLIPLLQNPTRLMTEFVKMLINILPGSPHILTRLKLR